VLNPIADVHYVGKYFGGRAIANKDLLPPEKPLSVGAEAAFTPATISTKVPPMVWGVDMTLLVKTAKKVFLCLDCAVKFFFC